MEIRRRITTILISVIVFYSHLQAESSTFQRTDGYHNNLAHITWGGAGETLIQNITPNYADYTYKVHNKDRPSARTISNELFRQDMSKATGGSTHNYTALFAFFGQLVDFELTDVDDTTCPVELMSIPVPRCDPDFDPQCSGSVSMPYERAEYSKKTGQSPNAPRQQVNHATSFIDASFIYGTNTVRTAFLREEKSAFLASGDQWRKYPERNDIGVPYDSYPSTSHTVPNPESLWKLGDEHVHQNPAVLSFGVLFYRWHNHLAKIFNEKHKNLEPHDVFIKSRQWAIASLQNIIVYEWLPKLLKTNLPPYTGYKASVQPGITAVFDAIAMRYMMTLIPAAIYQRKHSCDPNETREGYDALRLCNTYFGSQDILLEHYNGVEETLMGLATQKAEKEDIYIVEDIQSKWFGPLHYSRHDHVAQTIMRGRDYGLPDYNTVRKEMGMKQVSDWGEINRVLNTTHPEVFVKLRNIYGNLDHIDPFVGAMLETANDGPGELISAIIIDQFTRIRDGDRFWFENLQNGIFTPEEIKDIKKITLWDVIVNSTEIEENEIQRDVFSANDSLCPPVYVTLDMVETCTGHRGYDYFAGSEVGFIIVWSCFGLIPFICVLSAYIAAKCRSWKHSKAVNRQQMNNYRSNDAEANKTDTQSFNALEWLGKNISSRPVVVKLKPKCIVDVVSSRGTRLRTLGLGHSSDVDIYRSTNKGRTTLMIKVPKEYDLVLVFPAFNLRNQFEDALCKLLSSHNRQANIHDVRLKHILKTAFTQIKRNAVLEKFFKTVFSEAFDMDYDPDLEDTEFESSQTAKETLEIELSKEEFAHALGIKPTSEFVSNMFSLLDSDGHGYISYRKFLTAVVLFSKGTCEDKLKLIFEMFDNDSSGSLDKNELIKLFGSLLDMANSNISKDAVVNLVESMCSQTGLQKQTSFNFDEFCQILSPQMNKIWNAGLEWKGRKNCYPTPQDKRKSTDNRRKSADVRRKGSGGSDESLRQCNGSTSSLSSSSSSERRTRFKAIREKYHPVKAKMKDIAHFVENNRQNIFFLVLFYGVCGGLFAERFYYYTVEREHSGLRALMSYGISFTRGAAAGMSFTFSLLLLTMCRNIITWLRGTFLNLYVPFDSHVAFHKIVAWTALFFTGLHVIGYSFNFYQLATQPTGYLCIFDSIVLRSDSHVGFLFWMFGNMTGFTGVLLVVVICIVYVFATQTARRFIFNGFWLTHKLIIIMYILTILHGASLIVQKPMFFAYFIVPALLFTIDKLVSLSRKKTEITVMKAEKLPSDITYLEFKRPPKFEYKSGQWVRIACLTQGKNEYHPFTLTSAPHEDNLSLHIRALGPWTWNIRQTFVPENLKDGPYPKLYLDGPYGAGQQDWYQYDVSVLVGAGIGVTPYASILKDFVHMAMMRNTYRMKCQKLYFVWITASQRHFEWLLDIIKEVEDVDEKGIVSTDIFITKFFQNFDLRTSMLYVCEEHFQKLSGGCSVFTGLKANTHFGRPKLNEMFEAVHKAHPMVRKVGVFSCGPAGVTKSVEQGCIEASNCTRAQFEHHFENF